MAIISTHTSIKLLLIQQILSLSPGTKKPTVEKKMFMIKMLIILTYVKQHPLGLGNTFI